MSPSTSSNVSQVSRSKYRTSDLPTHREVADPVYPNQIVNDPPHGSPMRNDTHMTNDFVDTRAHTLRESSIVQRTGI